MNAVISEDERYRYLLQREWPRTMFEQTRIVCWVMLNPSTADATEDDPTIRRCAGYSMSWGFSGFDVVNLCAFRATDPKAMLALTRSERTGPDNQGHVWQAMMRASAVVFAWGAHGDDLVEEVTIVVDLALAANHRAVCLGVTKTGQPRHPLYMPKRIGLNDLREWPS